MERGGVQQPEVLKYLSGEISFETWLEAQREEPSQNSFEYGQPSSLSHNIYSNNKYGGIGDDESSTIFSSWGSAFTGATGSGATEEDDADTNAEDSQDEEDGTEDDIRGEPVTVGESDQGNQWNLILPMYEEPSITGADTIKDNQLSGGELVRIAEALHEMIKTSKIRKKITKMRSRNLRSDNDEPLDIVTDFQQFQFRKRHKSTMRTRLPELLRLRMGQANLLVAKGDFKQAADICMEIVRQAPSSGLPFKTLAFIYEEQGDKEMSLQYSLISAFLGCKDPQEWRDLAKKCLDAGNNKQALACYDRGCRFAGGDVSLHWERANMYFDENDYRKVLDIYQEIFKLLVPSEEYKYVKLAKSISKLFNKCGLTEKAAETLEIAYSTCKSASDMEGLIMLCEILIGAKKYKRTLKLIATHCQVGVPPDVFRNYRMSQSTDDEAKLNKFIGQTVAGNYKDIGQMSADIVDQNLDGGDCLQLPGSKVSPQKRFTELRPSTTGFGGTLGEQAYDIPNSLPLNLRIMLALCLIKSNHFAPINKIVEPLFMKHLDDVDHYMFTIGEAYFEADKFEDALKFLHPLVDLEKYHQPSIWMKLAEIFEHMGEEQKCIEAYYKVLELAPLQASVRLTLATYLRSAGRDEEAIAVLSEYDDTQKRNEGSDITILSDEYILKVEEYEEWYKKCVDMYTNNKLQDFIYHSYILMHNYLMSSYSYNKKQTVSKALVWELLLKTLKVCMKFKEYGKAIRLVEQALFFRSYSESRKYRLELDYLQTTIYFIAGQYSKAFDCFRNLLVHETEKQINSNAIWNLFTQIVNKTLDKRHHRFTLRLLFKRPKLIPLIIQNGNNSHLSGTYKYAIDNTAIMDLNTLGEFSRAFREWPTYPLNSLLLGVSYLHLSCQKFHKTRHTSILHGLIFIFQYFNLRGQNQEAYFNVGRAFHQIGLVHFAVHYYNKALEFPLHNEKENRSSKVEYHPFMDLHREVAFNLSRIYKASGNMELARKTLQKYCWV